MAEDLLLIGSHGIVPHRRQSLERNRSGALRTEVFARSDASVSEYGPTTVAVGIATQRASYQGQDASGPGRLGVASVSPQSRCRRPVAGSPLRCGSAV
jgi:hypothetical protein